MSARTFKPGDEVYGVHGALGRYVGPVDGGFVVQPSLIVDEDEPPIFQGVEVWPKLFAKPPTAELHAEIAELEEQATTLRKELARLRDVHHTLVLTEHARTRRLKEYEALAMLDDFLAGKITHFVTDERGSVAIVPFEEAKCRSHHYGNPMRLLSLSMQPPKNGVPGPVELQWNLNTYADGSGSDTKAWPCTSLEQARETAGKILDLCYATWRTKSKEQFFNEHRQAAASAKTLGFPVPDDVAQSLHDELLGWARTTLEKAEAEAATARAKLNAMLDIAPGGVA